ncbi:hypothetical protein QQS21_009835 [Conoideocrella luteorostrata]|uniref:Rhodopsin domain-containing protein n=1 Tax=Conoideocrella luteorostrata TaxID=1105319 RepID=A0AAJ0CG98_9HYPO|nr:hypothetical protein QQS21_009835 [Conoideocrella luteorostrata]
MMIVLGTFAAVIVTIRLHFKHIYGAKQHLESDDWIILSAVPIGITTIVLTMTGLTAHGLGKDLWGVSRSDLRAFGAYFYAMQILYIFLMAQLKLSLCFFYLNIFSGTTIRRLLWGTVAFHVAFSFAFMVAATFQCTPISYHWNKFDFSDGPLRDGYCANINAAGWANGAITVASDFWLLAIPLSQVRRLKLHWKKKAGVALMFLTGAM